MNSEKKKKANKEAIEALENEINESRIINPETSFETIEAYKATRTNIMFSLNSEEGCKKVIITSPTSGEGKTTSSINLAFTFAEMGAKILLVDADLRAPRVHKYTKLVNDKGLSNILAGFDDFDSCVKKEIRQNVDCILSGPIPPNPVELISSERMNKFMDDISKKYDYVFIDTPPLNIVTEALILSKLVHGVILVTRQKYTMYKMIEKAINSLKFAKAKIIGFILNDAEEDKYSYGNYKSGRGYRNGRYDRYGRYARYGKSGYGSADFEKLSNEKNNSEKQNAGLNSNSEQN